MKKAYLLIFACCLAFTQTMAHVNLLNPTGGEMYNVGETVTLQWQIAISHNIQNWDLSISIDNGVTWEAVELDIPSTGSAVGTTVSYDWLVPNTPSTQVKLLIVMDNSGTDYDDTSPAFTISTTVGIADSWSQTELDVFPNPVKIGEDLWISYPNDGSEISNIQIFNSNGAIAKSIPMNKGNVPELIKVNLNGLKQGLHYMVLLSTKSAVQKKSFVIR